MNKKVKKILLIYENHVYAKCSYVYSCHTYIIWYTYILHTHTIRVHFFSQYNERMIIYIYIYCIYVCIVQCILFLPYSIWNKSCLLFDDFWKYLKRHPPTILLFLRLVWRSGCILNYMSEIHGLRINLQTLTYSFTIVIICRII